MRLLNINNQADILHEAYPFFANFVPQWHYDQSPLPLASLDWLKTVLAEAHHILNIAVDLRELALQISEHLRMINE